MSDQLFDPRACHLGEGSLWHPLRQELFWFDILNRKLYARSLKTGTARGFDLPLMASAAAWVDAEQLVIASETGLDLFDIAAGRLGKRLCSIEADDPQTRSNDGRADRRGGFWIGTMGKAAEAGAGAIYRFYRGELQRLFSGITIPNAICFAPSGDLAYFADTAKGQIYRCALDTEGWPKARPELFADLGARGLHPDGAVTLSDGSLRIALWGAGAVLEISAKGEIGAMQSFAAPNLTCPAMGGAGFKTLFCTSAQQDLSAEDLQKAPLSGATFMGESRVAGLPEPAFCADY